MTPTHRPISNDHPHPRHPYLSTAGAAIATKVGEDVEARLAPANYLGQIGRLV